MSIIQSLISETIEEATKVVEWPKEYVNQQTKKPFRMPADEHVEHYIMSDRPKYLLFAAPEGSGKTAVGTRKCLDKLRRGMSGALICPDYPYMVRILREVWNWVPWDCVIDKYRHYGQTGWSPYKGSFEIVFHNELGGHSTLLIGGISDNYTKWESLNLSFVWVEEARSIKNSKIMDVLTGRIRLDGPNGEPPQLYITSTPTSKDHWLYRYFGPIEKNDKLAGFKKKSKVVKLSLLENMENLNADYIEDRIVALSENEKKMRVDGEWGEDDAENPFVPDMQLWDRLNDRNLLPLRKKNDAGRDWSDSMVLGVDGSTRHDHFAIVGVTRHPENREMVAVRHVKIWKPEGEFLDFQEQESYIRKLCEEYNVVCIVYDRFQLHQMMTGLGKSYWTKEFSQSGPRTVADNQLFQAIMQEKISHSGQEELRDHVKNADAKIDEAEHQRRIIKRYDSLKIDSLVALSMAHSECKRLNL